MFYVCGNISLVVQCSLVLVKFNNVRCKDIELHVEFKHIEQSDILSQNIFSYSCLRNSSKLIYEKIKAGKRQEKKKNSQGRTFFSYSMKSEKKNLNGGRSEIFAESPDLCQGNCAEWSYEMSITPLAILKLPLPILTSKSTCDMIRNSFIPLNAHKFLRVHGS